MTGKYDITIPLQRVSSHQVNDHLTYTHLTYVHEAVLHLEQLKHQYHQTILRDISEDDWHYFSESDTFDNRGVVSVECVLHHRKLPDRVKAVPEEYWHVPQDGSRRYLDREKMETDGVKEFSPYDMNMIAMELLKDADIGDGYVVHDARLSIIASTSDEELLLAIPDELLGYVLELLTG